MSRRDYEEAKVIRFEDHSIYALLMAAMMKADSYNSVKLQEAYPALWDELQERYYAPGGYLPGEREEKDAQHTTPADG